MGYRWSYAVAAATTSQYCHDSPPSKHTKVHPPNKTHTHGNTHVSPRHALSRMRCHRDTRRRRGKEEEKNQNIGCLLRRMCPYPEPRWAMIGEDRDHSLGPGEFPATY